MSSVVWTRESSSMYDTPEKPRFPEEIFASVIRTSIPEFDIFVSYSYDSWKTLNHVRPLTAVMGI